MSISPSAQSAEPGVEVSPALVFGLPAGFSAEESTLGQQNFNDADTGGTNYFESAS
ncbi:hypothetical protein [Streptomyces clavuligerus]|uniref:hypothetical protein n=1 Tax=Streptomyces clavuligerus TaxID=1901 RepID=UPI0001851C16|nr:hypothetical protein [Streptomyces clavuligerus]WDN56089.1 hypothetical protein LL058_29895 [Streptomyces clavuligerus]